MNKTILFDNQKLFGEGGLTLIPLSWRREILERGFAGLDGVVHIDLGRRERKLKQRGYLSSGSVGTLQLMIDKINNYINGQLYDLVDLYGNLIRNVRMDLFTMTGPIKTGNHAGCEYEIIYTQLSL